MLTPSMSWHDHVNGGDREMFWFDGLDLPMVAALDGVFFEEHPGPGENQPEPAEHNVSEREHAAGTRYAPGAAAELDRLAEASAEPLPALEYVDPGTGASVLPTPACAVHRIRAGRRCTPVRRTGNAVYVAFAGHSSSVIDGLRFDWGPRDMFVVPSWAAVEHASDEQADLFVLTDAPRPAGSGCSASRSSPSPRR